MITEAITLAMHEEDQNWEDKTACLGTAGDTLMVGQHGGVFGILKQDIPSLVTVHCVPHKLESGLKDTLAPLPSERNATRHVEVLQVSLKDTGLINEWEGLQVQ